METKSIVEMEIFLVTSMQTKLWFEINKKRKQNSKPILNGDDDLNLSQFFWNVTHDITDFSWLNPSKPPSSSSVLFHDFFSKIFLIF